MHVYAEFIAGDGQVVFCAEVECVLDAFLQASLVPLAEFHVEAGGGTGLGSGVVAWPRAFNLEERVVDPGGTLVRKGHRGVGMKAVDGVVVVHRGQVLEFVGAVPLVAADHDRVLGSVLADCPENFVFYFVPNQGVGRSGLVQELHHHAGLAAVTFGHKRPDLGGILAGIGTYKEWLLLVRAEVKVVARALVQVKNHVQVICQNVLDGLVQQSENFFFRLDRSFVEQVEVVHRQAHVVEPRTADALEIAVPKECLDVFNDPGKPYGIFFLDAVYLTEPSTQIHSPQSFIDHCIIPVCEKAELPYSLTIVRSSSAMFKLMITSMSSGRSLKSTTRPTFFDSSFCFSNRTTSKIFILTTASCVTGISTVMPLLIGPSTILPLNTRDVWSSPSEVFFT